MRSVLKDALGRFVPLDGDLRVWLDDDLIDRPAPEGWIHLVTSREVCFLLLTARVVELSLDNDLNGDIQYGVGFQVTDFLFQELVANGRNLYPRDGITLHTANPSARDRMASSIMNAGRYGVTVSKTVTPSGKPHLTFAAR